MKKTFSLLSSLLLLVSFAAGQAIDLPSEIRSLVQSEKAFCKASIEKGTREAFLSYLADDGIIFRPHPVNGKQWMRDHPPSPGILTWTPRKAEVSNSGDLGYTTGPWEFRKDSLSAEPVGYGNYVSIWRKQADGSWKLILDAGAVNPKPETAAQPLPSLKERLRTAGKRSGKVDVEAEQATLVAADSNLSRSLREGATVAIFRQFTDNVTFLRTNMQPLIGRHAVRQVVPEKFGQFSAKASKAEVSSAGDLGYTYGSYELKGTASAAEAAEQGNYVRIWKKQIEGRWKLTLEVLVPIPPPDKKS